MKNLIEIINISHHIYTHHPLLYGSPSSQPLLGRGAGGSGNASLAQRGAKVTGVLSPWSPRDGLREGGGGETGQDSEFFASFKSLILSARAALCSGESRRFFGADSESHTAKSGFSEYSMGFLLLSCFCLRTMGISV